MESLHAFLMRLQIPSSQLYKLFTNIRHGDQNLFHGQGQMCLESNQELILFLEKGGFMVDHHILVDSCLFSVYFLGVTVSSLTSMPQSNCFLFLECPPSGCWFLKHSWRFSGYWDAVPGWVFPQSSSVICTASIIFYHHHTMLFISVLFPLY